MTTVVLVQQGGTGSNNASDARSALGAAPTAAYDQANAAFAAANSGSSSAGAAYNQANAAYTQANTARSDANTTFATVNTTFGTVNTSVSTANTQANSGRDQANAAYGQANTSYGQANSARDQANTAYGQANLAYTQANSAFTAANNSNLKSGGIISGTLNVTNDIIVGGNVYLQGNTTFINVSTYQVNDPLMYIAANNTLTDSVDIGFIGAKNTSGTFSHTGLARDATDGKYKLFDGLPDNDHIGNVINFANTYLATLVANVEANTLRVVNSVTGNVNFDSGTLFVDSVNDRVGVGTTTPSYKLHVAGTGYTSGNFTSGGIIETLTTVQSSSGSDLSLNANGANRDVFFKVNSSTLAMVQGSTGNFGVGTNSPSRALTIEKSGAAFPSASNPTIRLNETSSGRFALMELDSNQNLTIWNGDTGSGSIRFYRGSGSGTLSMSLDGSGNVGIGTASPTAKLHVYTTTNYTGNLTFDGVASIGPVLNIEAPGNVYTEFRLGSWALTRAKLRVEGYSGAGSGTGGGTLSLWTGDTSGVQQQRVTIDGVGNVGIGATIPSYKLQVSGSSGTVGVGLVGTYASGDVGLYIAPNAIIGSYSAISSNPNASTGVNYIFGSANSTSSSAHSRVDISAGGASGGDPKLTYTISGVLNWSLGVDNSDSDKFKISASDSPGTSDLLTIDTSGNVGIGATSPVSRLNIRYPYSGSNVTTFGKVSESHIHLGDPGWNNQYSQITFGYDSTNAAAAFGFLVTDQSGTTKGALVFATRDVTTSTLPTERMRITSAGNVGIGTTSPAARLEISSSFANSAVEEIARISRTGGDTSYSTGRAAAITFYDTPNPTLTAAIAGVRNAASGHFNGSLAFYTSNTLSFSATTVANLTQQMIITNTGAVGIGTTSPSTKLDVSGTITCTALTETSSITFKENVDPIQNALNSITKLVGVTYDRKDGSAKQKAGLIAEEVNEVLPNLVQKDADGNAYGIHYTNLIAYLVESIKELNNKIERLESNR